MTGHQINSLVGDLVAMAQAMERLPQVEQEVSRLQNEISALERGNHDLRESNDILREHIAQCETKIKEVTQERDDASFRVLETEDKLAAWERLAKAYVNDVNALVKAQTPEVVEPPKPEPVYTASGFEGQRVADPTSSNETGHGEAGNASMVSGSVHTDPWPRNERGQFAPGQGVDHPTSTVATSTESSTGSVSGSAMSTESVNTGTTTNEPKPFAGKLYINVPGWLSRQQWLDGGGTDATYDWRQGQPLPDGIAA